MRRSGHRGRRGRRVPSSPSNRLEGPVPESGVVPGRTGRTAPGRLSFMWVERVLLRISQSVKLLSTGTHSISWRFLNRQFTPTLPRGGVPDSTPKLLYFRPEPQTVLSRLLVSNDTTTNIDNPFDSGPLQLTFLSWVVAFTQSEVRPSQVPGTRGPVATEVWTKGLD